MLYAEDLDAGTVFPLGCRSLTAAEIMEFARAWDPMPFHVEEAAALASPFGGLIASGLHTIAVAQRLLFDAFMDRTHVIAGLGVDGLRMTGPVRPGTVITGQAEILDRRLRDADGVVTFRTALVDGDDGSALLTQRTTMLVGRRPA